jgi:hypothetical protein
MAHFSWAVLASCIGNPDEEQTGADERLDTRALTGAPEAVQRWFEEVRSHHRPVQLERECGKDAIRLSTFFCSQERVEVLAAGTCRALAKLQQGIVEISSGTHDALLRDYFRQPDRPRILEVLGAMQRDLRDVALTCPSPWQLDLCAIGIAAYAPFVGIVLCDKFFDEVPVQWQPYMLIHEAGHLSAGLSDNAWYRPRLCGRFSASCLQRELTPGQLHRNADTYAVLIEEITAGD